MKRVSAILAVAIGVLAFSSSAVADEPVYWKQLAGTDLPKAGKSVIEPQQMFVVSGQCSGCGYRLVDLTWEGWGSVTATGRGKVVPIGGPGTCGYPPKGCSYPNIKGTVYLTEARQTCGERRYMTVRTLIKGESYRYPDVDCDGMYRLSEPPLPKPSKPRLKRVTAKSLFNRTVKKRLPYGGQGRKYLRCHRAARLRFRCRGKWEQIGYYDGGEVLLPFKIRGWVKRSGRDYTVRIKAKYWNVYGHGLPTGGPYYWDDWGYYVVR